MSASAYSESASERDYATTLERVKCADQAYSLAIEVFGAERVESMLMAKLEDVDADVIESWWERFA